MTIKDGRKSPLIPDSVRKQERVKPWPEPSSGSSGSSGGSQNSQNHGNNQGSNSQKPRDKEP